MPKKKDLPVTGSLLQDVTLPKAGQLDEGEVELFQGGELEPVPPTDPQDQAVKDFLAGK